MHIVIAGMGQVGQTVATKLDEEHSVSVIDRDSEQLDQVPYRIEAVQGNANSMETLKKAGIESANILVTCTSDDQSNILICSTARTLSDALMVARVSNPGYLDTWEASKQAFGVDLMVGRATLCAERIVKLVGFQSRRESAREVEYFVDGRVEMAEYEVQDDSDLSNQSVRQADQYRGLTFAALFRENELIIPEGNTRIRPGDRIVVIGEPEVVQSFGLDMNPSETDSEISDIVILGGGDIGYQTAVCLEERGISPRIVEVDSERAQYLGEHLQNTLVLKGDAISRELWNQERLDQADMHIVTLCPDERSILTGLMGKEMGIDCVLSVVHDQQYVPVFERSDIDMTVHPREVVADEIIEYTRERYADRISALEHHQAEVFEVEVSRDSDLTGYTIEESRQYLPDQMVYGVIYRNDRLIPPRGETTIKPGDHLVILSSADDAEDIADAF